MCLFRSCGHLRCIRLGTKVGETHIHRTVCILNGTRTCRNLITKAHGEIRPPFAQLVSHYSHKHLPRPYLSSTTSHIPRELLLEHTTSTSNSHHVRFRQHSQGQDNWQRERRRLDRARSSMFIPHPTIATVLTSISLSTSYAPWSQRADSLITT